MMNSFELPQKFQDLQPFSEWCLSTERERNRKRLSSSMADIQKFYDVMIARVNAALEYLNTFPLEGLPQPEKNLLNMTLSLAEVANAVELFKTQPGVIDGFDMERFYMIHENETVPDAG